MSFKGLQANGLQQRTGPMLDGFDRNPRNARREKHVFHHRLPWQQRRILEHHPHVAARTGHRRAGNHQQAVADFLQSAADHEQRTLAAPARSEDRYEFALLDAEIDIVQGFDGLAVGIIDLAQSVAANEGHERQPLRDQRIQVKSFETLASEPCTPLHSASVNLTPPANLLETTFSRSGRLPSGATYFMTRSVMVL